MPLSTEIDRQIRERIDALLEEKVRQPSGGGVMRALEEIYAAGLEQLVTEFGHHFPSTDAARQTLNTRIYLAIISRPAQRDLEKFNSGGFNIPAASQEEADAREEAAKAKARAEMERVRSESEVERAQRDLAEFNTAVKGTISPGAQARLVKEQEILSAWTRLVLGYDETAARGALGEQLVNQLTPLINEAKTMLGPAIAAAEALSQSNRSTTEGGSK